MSSFIFSSKMTCPLAVIADCQMDCLGLPLAPVLAIRCSFGQYLKWYARPQEICASERGALLSKAAVRPEMRVGFRPKV